MKKIIYHGCNNKEGMEALNFYSRCKKSYDKQVSQMCDLEVKHLPGYVTDKQNSLDQIRWRANCTVRLIVNHISCEERLDEFSSCGKPQTGTGDVNIVDKTDPLNVMN